MTYAQAEAAARLDLAKQDRIDASGVTGTAKRKISSIKKKWDNGPTSTARVLKEIAKQKAATGVGLMVGSGVLGTNGNLATAITSGAAIKGAVGEFLASEEKDIMFDSKGYANAAGINSIGDLAITDINILIKHFKSMGKMMHEYANGIDDSKVEYEYRERKGIGFSRTLSEDTEDKETLYSYLNTFSSCNIKI